MKKSIYLNTTEKKFLGRIVRSKIPMKNSIGILPAGSLFKITRKYGGFSLESEPCPHCGMILRITGVSYQDIDLI